MLPIIATVIQTTEGYCIVDGDGRSHPIMLGARAVSAFNPGWEPLFAYSGLTGLVLLELRHHNGQRATWFLDGGLKRIGDKPADLPEQTRASLTNPIQSIRDDIWRQLMLAERPALSPPARAFFLLNLATRRAILGMAEPSPAAVRWVDVTTGGDELPREVVSVGIRPDLMRQLFSASLTGRFIAACETGQLTWPSPVDGRPMRLLGGLALDDFRFAYRLLDEKNKLTVVLLVTTHGQRTIALYLPELSIVLDNAPNMRAALQGNMIQVIELHLHRCGDVLEGCMGKTPRGYGSVLRGRPGVHLGHQLWNELTGIEKVVHSLPIEKLPNVLIPNASEGVEIYGPLEHLFPELGSKVRRFSGNIHGVIDWAYRNGICLTRLSELVVTGSLRKCILSIASDSPEAMDAKARIETVRKQSRPIVVLGLRVENRTHTDLEGFFGDMIALLSARLGPAVFVLDGHNRRLAGDPGSVFESHGEGAASSPPSQVERTIAANLMQRFANTPSEIVSTIGAPMPASLLWASAAHFFIAIWGAGLAKYRWVANRPGFILSSAWNLSRRSDLHIYDNPAQMQDPTEVVFVDPELVTDCPDCALLISPGSLNSYMNFMVDARSVWPAVTGLLDRLGL